MSISCIPREESAFPSQFLLGLAMAASIWALLGIVVAIT